MTTQSLRRGCAAIAAAALGASVLGVVTGAPAQAAESDPGPAAAASGWLGDQLTDGLVFNDQFGFKDYGLSVDVGLALAELGDDETVDEISAALAPEVRSYYTYPVAEGKTHVSAGSLAKAVAFAQVAGDDASAYGGEDLVSQLEERISQDAASAGRLTDVFFPEEPFEQDFSNTIGQAYASSALDTEGSALTGPVTEYLLAQQCEEGFFRLDLGATAAATCDADEAAEASVDVTAIAVLNLQSQTDDADVQAAVGSALSWLTRVQNRDGSFGSDAQITTANANSTGLAGWALGEAGIEIPAEDAAIWVRGHQAEAVAGCATALDTADGAVAYDDAALTAGREAGVTTEAQDQFRRATAQAAPALRYAPLRNRIWIDRFPPYFADAGTKASFFVSGFRPGETVCVTGPGVKLLSTASLAGDVRFDYTVLPGQRTYRGAGGSGDVSGVTITGLAKKTLNVKLSKKQVKRGATQVVRVGGLVKGERVVVKRNGRTVARTEARRAPLTVRIPSGAKLGKVKVVVVGQYNDRRGSATFRVVR